MKKYVIKRDENSLPERLTRYRNELNEQQFRVVTAKPNAALVVAGAGTGKTRNDNLSRRIFDRARRFAAENFARDFYQSRGAEKC